MSAAIQHIRFIIPVRFFDTTAAKIGIVWNPGKNVFHYVL
jgi:hypothetical protein